MKIWYLLNKGISLREFFLKFGLYATTLTVAEWHIQATFVGLLLTTHGNDGGRGYVLSTVVNRRSSPVDHTQRLAALCTAR